MSHLAGDRTEALETFNSHRPAVTILDLGLPPRPNEPEEGLADALAGLLALDRTAKVIIISGQGEKDNALRAVGAGAYDFFCKPVEIEELKLLLRRCFYVANLEKELPRNATSVRGGSLRRHVRDEFRKCRSVFSVIRKVAPTPAPRFFCLGKAGPARRWRRWLFIGGARARTDPFVAINCNAIPENLIESELFGHEKGSFTGAHTQRKGLIESAAEARSFWTRSAICRSPIQVKLLRFLQEQSFQRVGGGRKFVPTREWSPQRTPI